MHEISLKLLIILEQPDVKYFKNSKQVDICIMTKGVDLINIFIILFYLLLEIHVKL